MGDPAGSADRQRGGGGRGAAFAGASVPRGRAKGPDCCSRWACTPCGTAGQRAVRETEDASRTVPPPGLVLGDLGGAQFARLQGHRRQHIAAQGHVGRRSGQPGDHGGAEGVGARRVGGGIGRWLAKRGRFRGARRWFITGVRLMPPTAE
jgi:hypothetical protein